MPRFRITVCLKQNQDESAQLIVRSIFRHHLAPNKIKAQNCYRYSASSATDPFACVMFTITDDSVSGYKDWSRKYLPSILEDMQKHDLEPYDGLIWGKTHPFIMVKVDEKLAYDDFDEAVANFPPELKYAEAI